MLASLNELCVRLVFLLYAEDADVFARRQFHDYLARREARDARRALIDLFKGFPAVNASGIPQRSVPRFSATCDLRLAT